MLLRTRFYLPPLRANTVVRSALLSRLSESKGGELLLVTAPAGYGKTTLVSQWLHRHSHPFTWLTLGSEHNAAEVFWRYAVMSLQQIQPSIGVEAETLWQKSQHQADEKLLISVLNDLDRLNEMNQSDQPISIVLDDFHHIKNSRLLGLINLFLDHLPSSVRIIITSRDQPELALAKRRASGQLLQLGAEHLRFTPEESACFFNSTMSLPADSGTVTTLCQQMEGWVTGLQLIALSMRSNVASASGLNLSQLDKHVADYLLDEVFSGQSESTQQFLLSTALPQRFCASLSNAMTDRKDSQRVILNLENSDLFIVPLDNHRTWYRYHDVFRQFLVLRAKALSEGPLLVERALEWLEHHGHYDDAIDLCLEFEYWNHALRLLNDDYVKEAFGSEPATLAQWIERLPSALQHQVKIVPKGQLEAATVATSLTLGAGLAIEPLTHREQAVLQLISQGLSNKAIAEQLHVSINTLKVHIRNLYGKLGVENRTQALLRITNSL